MPWPFMFPRNHQRGGAAGGVVVVITLALLAFVAALTFAVYATQPPR